MPVTKQSVTLNFLDPSGAPLASGSVIIRLQQDISSAASGGPQVVAGRPVKATLNSSGTVTVLLWPTTGMSPAAVYFVRAFTALGQPAWSGTMTVS